MWWFFKKKAEKEELDRLKGAVQTGFNSVKRDVGGLTKWIKHLDTKDSKLKDEILEMQEELSTLKDEVEGLRNIMSIVSDEGVFKDNLKQPQTVFNKQTVSKPVLNTVQTAVQTVFLNNLSATERAIIFVLLNSDMKLSYEDLASILGKTKSTIRGQVNSIRQKSESLIEETIGENNKKRVFIPEKTRDELLKSRKVSAENNKKNNRKNQENNEDYD